MNNAPKSVTVRAAATSANLGGGFDCLGVALGLYHTVTARFSEDFKISGDDGDPTGRDNLVYVAMNEVFKKFGKADANVEIASHSDIPRSSGLGSSAACVVAGVSAANALLGGPMSTSEVIDLCARLDGHPDNVLPAIVGGVTAAYKDVDGIGYLRTDAPEMIFAVATPDFGLSTKKARAVLPDKYTREDCVYSLQRAVATFGAFALGRVDMLKAVGDKLHQPYRAPLIQDYDEVRKAFKNAGAIESCLSGAGPSVIAFFKTENDAKNTALPDGWTLRILKADNNPIKVEIN
ncbi:MAG: homoserine kinase [Clostridiales bacterium]|nr:homoserine kinase [Clostridiales bacterium]